MGAPVSRYSALESLCNGNVESNQYKVFQRAKLFGIILSDPNDKEFTEVIQKKFDFLDKVTNENFLFMTFVDAIPPQWCERHMHDGLDEWCQKMTKENLRCEKEYADSDLVYSIKRKLEITEPLPVVLLTDDLNSGNFDVMKTSPQLICDQFEKLGSMCLKCDDAKVDRKSSEYQNLLKGLDSDYRMESHGLLLGNTIRNLSAPYAMNSDNWEFKEEAQKHSRIELAKLIVEIGNAMIKKEYDEERFDQLLLDYATCLSAFLKAPNSEDVDYNLGIHRGNPAPDLRYHLPDHRVQNCEPESMSFINTYNALRGFLHGYSGGIIGDEVDASKEVRVFDYSVITLPLTKFFENEINHSILQLIRKYNDIPMPEYYYKHFRTQEPIFFGKTDLNSKCDGRMIWPALGQTLYIWGIMMETPTKYPRIGYCGSVDGFGKAWNNIVKERNAGSHDVPKTEKGFLNCWNNLNAILDNGFEQMVEIKRWLREN